MQQLSAPNASTHPCHACVSAAPPVRFAPLALFDAPRPADIPMRPLPTRPRGVMLTLRGVMPTGPGWLKTWLAPTTPRVEEADGAGVNT